MGDRVDRVSVAKQIDLSKRNSFDDRESCLLPHVMTESELCQVSLSVSQSVWSGCRYIYRTARKISKPARHRQKLKRWMDWLDWPITTRMEFRIMVPRSLFCTQLTRASRTGAYGQQCTHKKLIRAYHAKYPFEKLLHEISILIITLPCHLSNLTIIAWYFQWGINKLHQVLGLVHQYGSFGL